MENPVLVLLAAALVVFATPARASTVISFSLPDLVQLTGLSDVTFNNPSLATDAVSAQSVCVWSNLVSRGYFVTATGTGGKFLLTDTMSSNTAQYNVSWSATAGAQSGTSLSPGQKSQTFISGSGTRGCSGGSAALSTLLITIPVANLQAMTGGRTYTGTLTILISPT